MGNHDDLAVIRSIRLFHKRAFSFLVLHSVWQKLPSGSSREVPRSYRPNLVHFLAKHGRSPQTPCRVVSQLSDKRKSERFLGLILVNEPVEIENTLYGGAPEFGL